MINSSQAKLQKGRLIIVAVSVALFWVALEVNLFYRQVVQHDLFEQAAAKQYLKKIPLRAVRGGIYDRLNNKLVNNTLQYDIAADPLIVKNKKKLARVCSKALHKPEAYFKKKLAGKRRFTYLARGVSDEDIRDILALKDPGLIKNKSFRREYPYRTYAAQLLGFTDPDDRGLSGLELQFDKELRGENGQAVIQYNGKNPRRMFFNADNPIQQPVNGSDIYLTLDKNIQTVVEEELAAGIERTRARAGMAVVLDPYSGAVLAMANYPVFDPNRQQKYAKPSKRNRSVTDVFEPGSTMKIFTSAALLQEQLKKEDDIVFCDKYELHDRKFHDTKKHGWLSFKKVVALSSNIGMLKLSEKLPPNTFFRYLRNFGFGTKTGLGLNGESNGILENPQKWSGITKASLAIGYGIGTTAIQMAAAYAAVVNGGYLYRPYIVDHIVNASGEIEKAAQPLMVRQVVSKEVSAKLKEFMYAVVEDGTGKNARVKGLMVGGKTGTARKMNPKTKRYSTSKYTASFIGFAPFDHPQYVLAVIMDEPKSSHYGGSTAAPVFSKIMQRIIYLDEQNAPSETGDHPAEILVEKMHKLPPVSGFRIENAQALLEAKKLNYKTVGSGLYVKRVFIKDKTLYLERGERTVRQDKVPRLTGLTLREAIQKVDLSRFRIELKGDASGTVRRQEPPPGKRVNKRTALILVCN